MEERYIRNLGALTEEDCAVLRGKTVFVAGCGGLGGYLIEMLLRLGVGEIRAADGDVFEASNLNRQLLATRKTVGQYKVDAAEERILEINPNHPVFTVLSGLDEKDERVAKYAGLLYEQALLIEGLPLTDPVAFSNAVCELMK